MEQSFLLTCPGACTVIMAFCFHNLAMPILTDNPVTQEVSLLFHSWQGVAEKGVE